MDGIFAAKRDSVKVGIHNEYKREAKACNGVCDVLFIGDSIADYMRRTPIWSNMLNKGIKAVNFGIGGDRIEHVLWRVQDGEWLDELRPKLVVLIVGTNNINTSPDLIAEAIHRLIQIIQAKTKAPVLFPTLLPKGEYPNGGRVQNDSANRLLRARLNTSSNSKMVELNCEGLVDSKGHMDHNLMHDYLHLTDRGYSSIFKPLFEEIDNMLLKLNK